MTDRVAALLLGFPAWAALVAVFALPALESSAFVGFVFPGEIALILGGLLAQQGRVALVAVLAAGFAGAVVGDSVGYAVGRRYGHRVLGGTLGRFVERDRLDRAERYLAARGGRAVFLGRFTAALRVMIPGAAGMVGMRYRTFAVYNVAGAAGWVVLSVLLGYLGGRSWQRVEHVASRVGLGALVLLVVLLSAGVAWRRARRTSGATVLVRLRDGDPVRWVGARFPRTAGWIGRRLDGGTGRGLAATAAGVALGVLTWSFLAITQDVAGHDELAADDPGIHDWVVAHRVPALDAFFRLVTHLGSNAVLVPLLVIVMGTVGWRRRTWRPIVTTALVYGVAAVLHVVVGAWLQRPRPPATDWIAPASGWSYPSGHTAQAWVGWGMLALVVVGYARPGLGRERRRLGTAVTIGAVALAVVIATLVSLSRVYLGVHWPTDVLGSTTMGLALLAAVVLERLLRSAGRSGDLDEPLGPEHASGQRPGQREQQGDGAQAAGALRGVSGEGGALGGEVGAHVHGEADR